MVVAYLLWWFLGVLGIHRFYLGKIKTGLAQLLLLAFGWIPLFIGWIVLGFWWLLDAYFVFKYDCALCPALADQCCIGDSAHSLKRGNRVRIATGNMKFFFGADNQIKQMKCRLQLFGNFLRFDKPAFTISMTCDPPQIRAIINIKGC